MSKKTSLILVFGILFSLFISVLIFGGDSDGSKSSQNSGNDNESGYHNDPRSIQRLISDPLVESAIDVSEILSGGVRKDGIPAINAPLVASLADAPGWIEEEGDGILYEHDGQARFYPYQVLVRHEIVNDTVDGVPILVTYCPLCYTGVVFDRVLDGEAKEFGVSGVLHNSNLLMYNRSHPESLWAQASGEAVVGSATGQSLTILPFDITTFKQFSATFPDGEIVIGEKGESSSYTFLPYGGDLRNPDLRFPAPGERDERLSPNDRVVGLVVDGKARAYHIPAVEKNAPFVDEFAGRSLQIDWDRDLGAVRVFDITEGKNERLALSASFWFSWVSTYPETSLYK